MAVPKKKVSKSRRNMRRYSAAYQLETPTVVVSHVDQSLVRPHRITKAMLLSGRYLETTAKFRKTQSTNT
jgi:ribosomal protein L32